jgi:toxin ParE1/3/4
MRKYRIAHEAVSDLDEIWSHIAQHNPTAADRLIARFKRAFEGIAEFPEMGKINERIGSKYRSFAVQDYVIFYCPRVGVIEILRVLHGFRDLDQFIGEEK